MSSPRAIATRLAQAENKKDKHPDLFLEIPDPLVLIKDANGQPVAVPDSGYGPDLAPHIPRPKVLTKINGEPIVVTDYSLPSLNGSKRFGL